MTMNKLLGLLSLLAVLPVHAAEPQPAPATTPAPSAAATPAPANATGSVARAQFTSAVQDREPTDKISNLLNDKAQIYYFSEIKNAANQKVTHRWEHDGKVMAEVGFDIGGDRWRVYSLKSLDPSWTGEWKVSVIGQDGSTLGASTFSYEKPPTPAPAAAPPAASQPAAPAAAQ